MSIADALAKFNAKPGVGDVIPMPKVVRDALDELRAETNRMAAIADRLEAALEKLGE